MLALARLLVVLVVAALAAPAMAQGFVPGDVNGDGVVDILDDTVLRRHLAGFEPAPAQTCGGCLPAPESEGLACDDGLFCTIGDTCMGGACVATMTRSCADTETCTLDVCDEAANACTNDPQTGPACDDGQFCTVGDACNAGACAGSARDCSGLTDACNLGACDELGDACAALPANEGGACDDGLFCTVADACAAGACAGAARDCADAYACTADLCDELADACTNPSLAVDPASVVASSSSQGSPLDACLVAGSGARLLVWTDLRDQIGQPVSGASVTIGGAAATESATQPGVYYREIVAEPAVGQTVAAVEVTACSVPVTLASTVVIDHVAANASDGGTGGCAGPDGNVRVRVIAAETGVPIAGASVLLGDADANALEHSPEAPLGGASVPTSQAATTDAQGFASFYDYGAVLGGPITVTAGAAGRAYFTVVDTAASDVVLALPLLHAPAAPSSLYGNGTATSTSGWPPTGCEDVDLGLALPNLALDDLAPFDIAAHLEPERCWDSQNGLVGTSPLPANAFLPSQSVGPFCLGGALVQAPWALSLRNSPPSENLSMILKSAPYGDGMAALSSGFDALFLAAAHRRIGFLLDEVVSAPTSGRSFTMNETYPNSFVVNYAGIPPETDVVGVAAGDYDGTNGSGPLFALGTAVHPWDAAGSSLAIPNSDLNTPDAPASARRLAAISARFLDPATHPTPPPANLQDAVTTLLIRGDALPPFGPTGGTTSVGSFLDHAAVTFSAPATFRWQDASANGNAPLYSVHELALREDDYLPVLSCQSTNEVRPQRSVQWIVVKRFGAECASEECFTLPTLPAGFPRAASGPAQKSGFEALVGSGEACSTTCAGPGETCVDPDAAGPVPLQCMGGTGSAQDPYHTQAYEWHLEAYDLELLPGPFDFDAYRFADRTLYVTHVSSNRAPFD